MTKRQKVPIHFTTSTFVVNGNRTKTLLIFHKKVKRWMYPGGHLEDHEFPDIAALREFKEETGLEGKLISTGLELDLEQSHEEQVTAPICVLDIMIKSSSKDPEHHHIDLVYLVEADDSKRLNPETSSDARWFTYPEVQSLDTFVSIKQLAEQLLSRS